MSKETLKRKTFSFEVKGENIEKIENLIELEKEHYKLTSTSETLAILMIDIWASEFTGKNGKVLSLEAVKSSFQSASGLQPSLAESSLGSKETVSKPSPEPLRPFVTEKGGDESYTVPLAETDLIDEIVELELENKPMNTTWCPYGTIIKEAERLYKIHCSNPKEPTSSWLPKDRIINLLVCRNCGHRRQAVRDRRQKPSIVKEGSVIKWYCLLDGIWIELPNKKCEICQKQGYPRYLACQELQREYGLHSES